MLWMAATGVLFTLLNSTMKKLSHELDPWLVGFLRYTLGAMVMLAPALRFGLRELWPKTPKLQLLRGSFHAGGMLLWFAALPTVAGGVVILSSTLWLARRESRDSAASA